MPVQSVHKPFGYAFRHLASESWNFHKGDVFNVEVRHPHNYEIVPLFDEVQSLAKAISPDDDRISSVSKALQKTLFARDIQPAELNEAIAAAVSMAAEEESYFYPIEMPLTANGDGPADHADTARIAYEVWDVDCNTYGVSDTLSGAIALANVLNKAYRLLAKKGDV